MKSILHDLEEDYDPYYSRHGVSGSNAETCQYEAEEEAEHIEHMRLLSCQKK